MRAAGPSALLQPSKAAIAEADPGNPRARAGSISLIPMECAPSGVDSGPFRTQTLGASRMATRKPKQAPQHQDDLSVAERPATRKPRRYHVVLHNDDYTTQEFVVHVLVKFFHKGVTEATQIMLHVHLKGFGIVGVFT